MEELLLPYDDNWGSGAELIPYPALPRKAAVSKSVQKRREKQVKSFQKLVDSTIVLGRTSLPGEPSGYCWASSSRSSEGLQEGASTERSKYG